MGAGRLEVTLVSATIRQSQESLDAYATVRCGKLQSTTHTAKGQGELPSWNKTFKFDLQDETEILFEVFGVRPELDELLGLARIPVSKAVSSHQELITLSKPGGGGESGQLKAEFKWLPKMTTPPIETSLADLNINHPSPYSSPYPAAEYPPRTAEYPPRTSSYPPAPAEYPPLTSSYPPPLISYPPSPAEYPPRQSYEAPHKDQIYAPQGGSVSIHPPSYLDSGFPDASLPVTTVRGLGDKQDKGQHGSSSGGYGYPPQDPYGYPPQQHGGGYPPQQHGGGYPPQQPGYGGYPPPPPAGYPPAGYPPQHGGGYPPAAPGGYPATDSRLGGHGIAGAVAGAVTHGLQNMMHGGGHGAYGGGHGAYGGGHGAYGGAHGGYGHAAGYGYPAPHYGGHGKHKKFKHGKHGGGYMVGHGGHYGGHHGKHGKHGKHGMFGKHKGGKWK